MTLPGSRSGCCSLCPAAGKAECIPGEVPSAPSRCRAQREIFHLAFPPVQRGDANSHASSPGKRRGWIHLAGRRGSHWERGAGRSAERINLQRLGCRQSPVRRRPGSSGCIGAALCCSLCLPNASCAGLCESAFLQSEQDSGERQEDVRARGAWRGGGWRGGPH